MNNIKRLREDICMKQGELAKYLNVAQGTLSYWEQGKYDIDNKSLVRLAEYFSCSTDYILGVSDIRNPYRLDKSIDTVELLTQRGIKGKDKVVMLESILDAMKKSEYDTEFM